jgi:hypothetical protein
MDSCCSSHTVGDTECDEVNLSVDSLNEIELTVEQANFINHLDRETKIAINNDFNNNRAQARILKQLI